MKPVNGRNPLVLQAQQIHLPMPYEDLDADEDDDEDEWEEEPDDVDSVGVGEREPQSEDEQFNGVNRPPPSDAYPDRPRRRRRRRPPMPDVPVPPEGQLWEPPFEVLPDGTVTGPKISNEGDPPGTELPEGHNPPKGSFEGAAMLFQPPGSR